MINCVFVEELNEISIYGVIRSQRVYKMNKMILFDSDS